RPAADAPGVTRGAGDADKPAENGDPGGAAAEAAGDKPLLTNVQLLPPTAEAMVTEKLGLRRKVNGFCVVTAQPKDTLSTLVQKWCGKTDDYLEQAHGLNEELSTLHVGQEVTLPWVDAEVLIAAINARTAAPAVPA